MRPLAFVLLMGGAVASAQTPDFSGKWVVVPSAAAGGTSQGSAPPTLSAQGTMGSGWPSEITLTQDAVALTLEFTYFHPREAQPPFRFKYALDGSVSKNTINMGRGPQEKVSRVSVASGSMTITT